MRFEDIAAGELRQIDGPFSGVKVLDADVASGATLKVNDLAWPLRVLPSYTGPVDRIIATGPVLLVVAEGEDERVDRFAASPSKPGTPSRLIWERSFAFGAGVLADTGLLTANAVDRVWAVLRRPGNGTSVGISMYAPMPGDPTEVAVDTGTGSTTVDPISRMWTYNEPADSGQNAGLSNLIVCRVSFLPETFRIKASAVINTVPSTLTVRAYASRNARG